MFAIIETNGATHIAIHVPHQGAEKSLPAIAALLETNAVFIKQGYQEMGLVKPTMSILLGNTHRLEQYGVELEIQIPESTVLLDESFHVAEPKVFVSNAKAIKQRDDENKRLQTELSFVKQKLEALEAAKLAELAESDD